MIKDLEIRDLNVETVGEGASVKYKIIPVALGQETSLGRVYNIGLRDLSYFQLCARSSIVFIGKWWSKMKYLLPSKYFEKI